MGSDSYIRYNMSYVGRGVSEQFKKVLQNYYWFFRVYVEDCIRDLGNLVSLQIANISNLISSVQSISAQRAYNRYLDNTASRVRINGHDTIIRILFCMVI